MPEKLALAKIGEPAATSGDGWTVAAEAAAPGGLVLFGDLVRAVRRESAQAVGYWWSVGRSTVATWRRALGVELANPGTHRLRSAYAGQLWAVKALRKAVQNASEPEVRRMIAAARRGKPQPPHVGKAVARANRRREVTGATREN